MTPAELVVDASVVMRGLTADGASKDILDGIGAGEVRADAPELLVAEVANALTLAIRTNRFTLLQARFLLHSVLDSPLQLHPAADLAPAAVELAAETQLSAYDALYAVLARALGVQLVTADRKLAAAVPGARLVV